MDQRALEGMRACRVCECMAPELAAHHFFMLASSSGVAFGHLLAQSSSVVLQEIGTLRTRKPPPPPLQPLRESGTSLGRPCAGNWRAEAHESSTIANGAPRIRVAGRRQLTRVLARGFILGPGRTLRLLITHGVSWEKVARKHSAQTAMRLAFNEVPIPSYATGKRRELEIEQCFVGM